MSALPAPLVVLLTDFGLSDPYVGQLKGALYDCAPRLRLVDLSHDVAPHNVAQAGFFLASSFEHFPESTFFLVVVDPGVGTTRRIILLQKGARNVLAPDNGLLTALLDRPGAARAFAVHSLLVHTACPTFHGRDVFAPVAGRFLLGEPPHSLGEPVELDSLVRLPRAAPRLDGDTLSALVLHVDRFGNCVLNLAIETWARPLAPRRAPVLVAPTRHALRQVQTYGELAPEEIGLLPGSQGYFELAAHQSDAAARLGLTPGTPVEIAL
ncbi:SAM-dependent chlorinase/fluorinase [Fundidesulfovibrio butyratiphilus]